MADTDDEGLFAQTVASLDDFDIAGAEGIDALIDRAKAMPPCVNRYHQMLIDLFLEHAKRSGFHV